MNVQQFLHSIMKLNDFTKTCFRVSKTESVRHKFINHRIHPHLLQIVNFILIQTTSCTYAYPGTYRNIQNLHHVGNIYPIWRNKKRGIFPSADD